MAITPASDDAGPRTLAVEPALPTPAIPTPLNPDYKPETKDESKTNISLAQDRFDQYKKSQLQQNTPIKISDGEVYKWREETAGPAPSGWSDEEWKAYNGSGKGEWVLDTAGQLLLDEIDYAERLGKEISGSAGTARSAASIEGDKSDEITRQMKDFAYRANLYDDLLQDERDYSASGDDQNIQNWKAQQDLGMAINPGGFYGTPYQQDSLSSILRPSLPDYVSPDYRQNAAVGLPGGNGFNDPQYDSAGMPMFASGTEIPWPWSVKRGIR